MAVIAGLLYLACATLPSVGFEYMMCFSQGPEESLSCEKRFLSGSGECLDKVN